VRITDGFSGCLNAFIRPAQFEGTGVGLTIVRKAMERMNGRMGFESELGKGSKFWIQL
jgi:signal transduction histidine kinase